ncbi:hypothetical protein BC834DRAFT_496845 [Gloeopeniophorella convolvens]|nr:hypothetical protein BC834DRAFT_496845 [Gloeopeniophorella convolvens]
MARTHLLMVVCDRAALGRVDASSGRCSTTQASLNSGFHEHTHTRSLRPPLRLICTYALLKHSPQQRLMRAQAVSKPASFAAPRANVHGMSWPVAARCRRQTSTRHSISAPSINRPPRSRICKHHRPRSILNYCQPDSVASPHAAPRRCVNAKRPAEPGGDRDCAAGL